MSNILVIEDDEEIQETLQVVLELDGAQVKTASNGQEAIELLKKEKFELIITDIIMPIMTGYDVIRFVKENRLNVPIIVISQHDIAGKLNTNDIFELMAKPFRIGDILMTVEQARGH